MITQEQKDEFLILYQNADISKLYEKECYAGDFQILELSENITLKYERLYKNVMPHKTNSNGDIIAVIYGEEILLIELLNNIEQ